MDDKTFTLKLAIDAEEYRKLYAGQARDVVVRATNGQTLRFPAAALRPFVAHNGVRGHFEIQVTSDNRLVEIRRRGG
jgi:hypothetical protein